MWDGKQDRAFEELCFQLRDPTPPDAKLIKTSAPDAGLEWYWRWPDGAEKGWQVKYIFTTSDLLKAMRASLKSAASKRKGLRALTFCIPWDLADDPSRARGKQARERFDEAKSQWTEFAPDVEISLISGGELLARLALEEHRGREWFFFNERLLGQAWCAQELAYTIADAGDRYTPKQNVDLPVDRILEAVALPADLEAHLEELLGEVLRQARDLFDRPKGSWEATLSPIRDLLVGLEHHSLLEKDPPGLTTHPLLSRIEDCLRALRAFEEELRPVAWPEDSTGGTDKEAGPNDLARSLAQSLAVRSREVERALWAFQSYLESPACQAAESRALFIEGGAGQGKTHLFCDVAERLLAAGHPVVALLGERFREASPWKTLAALLGEPNLSPAEIATIFAASGEATGRRAVLFIDALNEAPQPEMWSSELADLRRRLTQTGWVGFAVSCRTTYLDVVEPPGGPDTAFVRIEHRGYQGREFEAIEKIFALYDLPQPRVPLLLPEFSNPLFLKLYCEGLADEPQPFNGAENLSAVFDRFVKKRTARVERKLRLDPHLGLVAAAVATFAKSLAEAGADRLEYRDAHRLINGLAPSLHESPKTLLETMVSEGLLAVDRGWRSDSDDPSEFVSFPYQRFSDHLVVSSFLDARLGSASRAEAEDAFRPDHELGQWLQEAAGGLIEALAIQLPEQWELELPDLLQEQATDEGPWPGYKQLRVRDAFLESVVLRDRRSFGSRTTELLNDELQSRPAATLEALIAIAPDPDHPHNGLRLHRFLFGMSMPERDSFWGTLTYDAFGYADHPLDRLIRWAARGPYPWCPDQVISLSSVPLIWAFASPNRFMRDYTTKALATLLKNRPKVQLELLDWFAGTNDPYVLQRLAAAIAGANMRCPYEQHDRPQAQALVEALVGTVIEHEDVIPDLQARDHIASLARWFRRKQLIPPRLLKRATPPYGSSPPKVPRRASYLEEAFPRSDERSEGYGLLQFSALSTHSDWSRYVVSGVVDDFIPTKLGEEPPPEESPAAPEARVNPGKWKRFEASLSSDQHALLRDLSDENVELLRNSLSEEQLTLLSRSYTRPKRRRRIQRPKMAYPPERASRFIFQRSVELGWTPDLFGEFDSRISRRSSYRASGKSERFGKKYQWIALSELLARLTDNFCFREWRKVVEYKAAWQLRHRFIDPTLPPEQISVGDELEVSKTPTFPTDRSPTWWTPPAPDLDILLTEAHGQWAERQEDLPSPEQILRVSDACSNQWVIVDGHHSWRYDPREAASIDLGDRPYRDLAILSAGTFIRTRDLQRLLRWLESNPDLVRALPDWGAHGIYGALWRELPDESDLHGHPGRWRRVGGDGRLPVRSAPVRLGYSNESGSYDCSLSEGIGVELPSRLLVEEAGLEWREDLNLWVDGSGREAMQYRETDVGFHRDRALLIRDDRLRDFLQTSDLSLAVGLFCERRVFNELGGARPEALGWVDYAAHLVFDGFNWIECGWSVVDRHGDSAKYGS
jgi:hypothetical protein